MHDELRPIYEAGAKHGIASVHLNLCELQEVASMLGVKDDDDLGPDLHAQALDVLAKRVHAAEAGQEFEAPQGWGTQITASELAAFNAAAPKRVEAVVDGAPVVFGMDDLFPVSASSPSEPQPTD